MEAEGLPRVSVTVTVEHDRMAEFADADRLIIDSLEIFAAAKGTAAQRSATKKGSSRR